MLRVVCQATERIAPGTPEDVFLFISGTPVKPQVTLNDDDVTAALKPWQQQDDVSGWLVSLTGDWLADDQIARRLSHD